ncbi:MAG: glycosyltransferase family 1 protein [Bacteroidales bacterium]|nr:glycosyltransferase family 1 protein [Bacteroidales bacterium]
MKNTSKHMHVVAFDIPYPATYGGVIDVFYKIKALFNQGVKIHLHCYQYGEREPQDELNKYCETVHYYKRHTGLKSAMSIKPYIVFSRRSEELVINLSKDRYPIIFEGLHSCSIIDDPRLGKRMKIYRAANIEHHYYYNLFKVDRKLKNKIYFLVESLKLRLFQKVLKHSDLILVVSRSDQDYLKRFFPEKKVAFIPTFHANDKLNILSGKGTYALYHGNLSVAENHNAVDFLINRVFKDINIPLKIAGKNPSLALKRSVEENDKIELIPNPSDKEMFDLIRNAHVNVLVTFQGTGLKLKLLNTLYNGRFNLVNRVMLNGTGLDEACVIADSPSDIKSKIQHLFTQKFNGEELHVREDKLSKNYDNKVIANNLTELVF